MKRFVLPVLTVLVLLSTTVPAIAQQTYRVTVTNITANQIISPPIVVSHSPRTTLFQPGVGASPGLTALAEDADPGTFLSELDANARVLGWAMADTVLLPGDRVTLEVEARGGYPLLSAVGMLVTTNDAFFGLDSFEVIGGLWKKNTTAPAWDAGTEANTESCEHIPGPPCGNPFVRVLDGAEGTVRIHPGIHGQGDLTTAGYTWLNPVVAIQVVRTSR